MFRQNFQNWTLRFMAVVTKSNTHEV